MDENKNTLTKEELEMIEETENFMKEVYADPEIANAPLPEGMRENILKGIREREEKKKNENVVPLTEEDRELIRLGKKYKKQIKLRKYFVIAAVLILGVAFGVTSMGGPEKVFESFKIFSFGRSQSQVNSDEGVEVVESITEDEIYQQLEDKLGFQPVRFIGFPEGVSFLEGCVGDDIQGAQLAYGIKDQAKMVYHIRPNYQISSWGKDIEDNLVEEYDLQVEEITIHVVRYRVENNTERWSAKFEHKDVNYSLLIMDSNQEEVEEILKNLYFS